MLQMISEKVVQKKSRFGEGLFARDNIKKGELVLIFEGRVYENKEAFDLSEDMQNHTVQCGDNEWIYPNDEAKLINHSCEPNCGINGLFKVVAMRDIKDGEELTFDYDMSEDSDWVLECDCRNKNCRKIIRGHRYLPKDLKVKYKGYISEWLIKKD